MANKSDNEPMLEMFYFETCQYLEQLEQSIITSEKANNYSQTIIDEIFRIMHNIKSSAAMMQIPNISTLAHTIEDLFFYIREQKPAQIDHTTLSDLVLESKDFIKVELEKITNGDPADGEIASLIENLRKFLSRLKNDIPSAGFTMNRFKAVFYFQEGCEMENIRAYAVVHRLQEIAQEIQYYPEDIIENDQSIQVIKEQGFTVLIKTDRTYNDLLEFFNQTAFLRDLELLQFKDDEIKDDEKLSPVTKPLNTEMETPRALEEKEMFSLEQGEKELQTITHQSIISVSVDKLDKLLDLVGEMVIAEAMVTQNPDLKGLELDNFHKAARQLRKITTEVQNTVMSIRMVPLATTFQKMNRIVRDMSKKLNKEVGLELIGQDTECDKNVIEHISDPLMHLVRNAIDHGIETPEERQQKGKSEPAKVCIEAKNAGSDVLIIVRDNGKGLDKEKILRHSKENGLFHKPENEMSDREIYNLIFLPGFSTKESISEYSGRGVGMDVVTKNIETVGGTVQVDSTVNEGTEVILRIPLTLAIIEGMNIEVGNSRYTIPITSIRESFRPQKADIITDPDGNEMIMVRGQCYPILRLHEIFAVETKISGFTEGILVMVENDDKKLCIFADRLIGEQQVVVKALPNYIKNVRRIKGLTGCTLLGDGSISLILDIAGLFEIIVAA